MKNIKINPKYIFALFIAIAFTTSCTQDESEKSNKPIEVDGIYSIDNSISPPFENSGKGYPFDIFKIEGRGLYKVKTIVIDNKINCVFNPQLNSDRAVVFPLAFNDKKGSRFGIQKLTITKENGEIFETNFNLLQPKPLINDKFEPAIPKVGTTVVVNGAWYFNIISVLFGAVQVNYTRISADQISFEVPVNAVSGEDVTINTAGGTVKRFLEIDQGFDVVKVTNFDGSGVRPNNNWNPYGSYSTLGYYNTAGISGYYAELTWAGSQTPVYNGCESSAGSAMLPSTATDATKAFYQIEVNCGGAVGTKIDVLIVDSDGGNWAYTYTIATTGWQSFEANLSDFGANYNSSNQSQGDVNPAKINQVKMTIYQGAGAVNPSKVQFDNIKFKILR